MPETKTYRGRTLEEVLPKIREELGPDALVLKRREGLAGGVGGFFQHPYVEVEARGPGSEEPVELRSGRATAEGMASPAMQALLAQASPFAARLAEASAQDSIGLYGPQPAAPEPVAEAPAPAPEPEPARQPIITPARVGDLEPEAAVEMEPEPMLELPAGAPEPVASPQAGAMR